MKFLLFFLISSSLSFTAFAQNTDTNNKTDEILKSVKEIKVILEKNNNAERLLDDLSRKIIKDSADIAEKAEEIKKLKKSNQDITSQKEDAEKNTKKVESQRNEDEKKEREALEEDIRLIINQGAIIDESILNNLKKRADRLSPNNEKKLLSFIKICDSLNFIKKIFDKPYDKVAISQGKKLLNNLKTAYKTDIDGNEKLKKDIEKIDQNLSNYCENTNQVYKIFNKAYPLRNYDKTAAGIDENKSGPFRNELIKGYYYYMNYSYLKNLVNEFKENPATQDEYQKKEQIICN